MSNSNSALDALRRDIDQIDARLLSAIAERTAAVRRVAAAKSASGGATIRPGREAAILRRVLGGGESLPRPVLGRIWRELISAYCRLQGDLEVSVCAPEKSVGYWDLARDHFGSATPMTLHKSPSVVLRAVSVGEATVGILPMPQDGESDPWWRNMGGAGLPRIVARLPFVDNPGARFEDLQAMVVAMMDVDPSGDDVSWLVVSASEQISRRSLGERLAAIGLKGQALAAHAESGAGESYLFEVEGDIGVDDRRLAEISKQLGGKYRVAAAGIYARPFAAG